MWPSLTGGRSTHDNAQLFEDRDKKTGQYWCQWFSLDQPSVKPKSWENITSPSNQKQTTSNKLKWLVCTILSFWPEQLSGVPLPWRGHACQSWKWTSPRSCRDVPSVPHDRSCAERSTAWGRWQRRQTRQSWSQDRDLPWCDGTGTLPARDTHTTFRIWKQWF